MRVFVLSALFLLLGGGCANSLSPEADDASPPAPTGGSPAMNTGLPTTLEFEMVPDLDARQQIALKVRAKPAGVYQVRFALPTGSGDPLDAVLDASVATTDSEGITSVVLTAPSSPTSFDVRASAGSAVQVLSLNVISSGFAALRVEPSYPTPLRDIPTWIATVHIGKTCTDVPGIPFADGMLKSPPAARDEAPYFAQVPAGTRLAVTLRSGHYVGGCTSVETLPPGPPERPEIVKVVVFNRPIDLAASSLAFSLDVPSPELTWSTTLTEAGEDVQAAIRGSGKMDDVDALLDAMREASGDGLQDFSTARELEAWDAVLRSRWGQNSGSKLHDLVNGWLSAGRQVFASAPHAFTGLLASLLKSEDASATGKATLTLSTVAGLEASTAGFIDSSVVSWSASSDDNVVLSADLYFVRSRLAEALAEAALLASDSSATSAPDRLIEALDCAGIAGALATLGTDSAEAYAGCDAGCLQDSCESALLAMWQRGGDVDTSAISRLSLTATGLGYVGDAAALTGLNGSWIGELTDQKDLPSTGGVLTASKPVDAK
jgi:hypothetical protein